MGLKGKRKGTDWAEVDGWAVMEPQNFSQELKSKIVLLKEMEDPKKLLSLKRL